MHNDPAVRRSVVCGSSKRRFGNVHAAEVVSAVVNCDEVVVHGKSVGQRRRRAAPAPAPAAAAASASAVAAAAATAATAAAAAAAAFVSGPSDMLSVSHDYADRLGSRGKIGWGGGGKGDLELLHRRPLT